MLNFILQSTQSAIEMAPGLVQEADTTSDLIVGLIAITGLAGVGTWLFFLWAIKDRQFDNVEDIASRVIELDKQETVQS